MNTHEKVEQIALEKRAKESESALLKLANQDIRRFIDACRANGFVDGFKTGFFVGLVVALIIYFIIY